VIFKAVGDWYLELEFEPESDLRAIEQIARICGGTNLDSVCKVSVIFVRGDLTAVALHTKNQLAEEADRGHCQLELQATDFPADVSAHTWDE